MFCEMNFKIKSMTKEFSIIEEIFLPLSGGAVAAQNFADDVAKISLKKDEELVVSKDVAIEDVHFLRKDGGFKIAAKILRANLSDIAASGAKPLYYMLGFCKNDKMDKKFISEFAHGLKETQDEFGISLIGGDTISSPDRLFFSITVFGVRKKNHALPRFGAKDGDAIFVSGDIGGAFLGLGLSQNKYKNNFSVAQQKYFSTRHFFPSPRISLGQNLVQQKLSSCAIDISDGLLADLKHLCEESKLSAFVYLDKIPLAVATNALPKTISSLDLISAGDDYELMFSAKKSAEKKILQLAQKLNIKISKIGYFKKAGNACDITLLNDKEQKINFSKYGYEH